MWASITETKRLSVIVCEFYQYKKSKIPSFFFYQNDGPPNRMTCEASLDQDEIIKTWEIFAFTSLPTTGLHSIIT